MVYTETLYKWIYVCSFTVKKNKYAKNEDGFALYRQKQCRMTSTVMTRIK